MLGLDDHIGMEETDEELNFAWKKVKRNIKTVQKQCEKAMKKMKEIENRA